jgi:hypothetical protein
MAWSSSMRFSEAGRSSSTIRTFIWLGFVDTKINTILFFLLPFVKYKTH